MGDLHQFRADWHDYNGGIYFITISACQHRHLFGHVVDAEMHLSPLGDIVDECIRQIPQHHTDVEVLNRVVMPNHLHLLIYIPANLPADEQQNVGCLKPPAHGEGSREKHFNSRLSIIVATLKAAVTRHARSRGVFGGRIWQPRFYERIIRNNDSYIQATAYIDNNIDRWAGLESSDYSAIPDIKF